MDITQLILDDHHEQRRLFAILEQIDRADAGKLAPVWSRLATFLEVHAAAEEALFYPALLEHGKGTGRDHSPTAETTDAIKDHNEIRDAIAAVANHPVGTDAWFDAVSAANKANGDHMAEEEREGLTDVREHLDVALRHELAVAFAVYEAEHASGVHAVNVKPKTYVERNS